LHIPDGFLSGQVAAGCAVVSAGALGWAVHQCNKNLQQRQVPFMGLMAAFVFAAQMLNFPVAGGTSGHVVGGFLLCALLGPGPGILAIFIVLLIQALLFQDGGISALGANLLNMGIVPAVLSYPLYKLLRKTAIAAFICGWLAVVLGAALCAFELALSGAAAAKVVFPAMVGVHSLIGIGEGLATVAVLKFLRSHKLGLTPLVEGGEKA